MKRKRLQKEKGVNVKETEVGLHFDLPLSSAIEVFFTRVAITLVADIL